jgi:2-polyprenyl-3-methyl-5-hydroxy-6-metoxy-1,4-benzoquinol methylase
MRSDNGICRELAGVCAINICWMIDSIGILDGELKIDGWAILSEGAFDDVVFAVNGTKFSRINYPLRSPDLAEHFYYFNNTENARFSCQIEIEKIPNRQYYCLEFIQNNNQAKAARTSWWYSTHQVVLPRFESERIGRVIGSNTNFNFELGGATLYNRIELYLQNKFAIRYADLSAILDWGCGAGRLLRHFDQLSGTEVYGADIDHDNLESCIEEFPFAKFSLLPLRPPTNLPEQYFDLIIGISVCTHLSEENQFLWLEELNRISKPSALVLLSVQGDAQSALYRESASLIRERDSKGFVVKGVNPEINGIIGKSDYYIDVIQTRENIMTNWGRHFEVIEFLDGFAANQDLVVLRKRN